MGPSPGLRYCCVVKSRKEVLSESFVNESVLKFDQTAQES